MKMRDLKVKVLNIFFFRNQKLPVFVAVLSGRHVLLCFLWGPSKFNTLKQKAMIKSLCYRCHELNMPKVAFLRFDAKNSANYRWPLTICYLQ